MKTNALSLFIIILIFNSCEQSQRTKELDNALKYADQNRIELEAVLEFYSKDSADSLKYKATCFLIENMPGHYSYKDSLYINKYYNEVDSVAAIYKDQGDPIKDSLFRQVKAKYNDKLELIEDIHYITANFLINNIECSFNVWQNEPWAKHIDFDNFCEYILPYKAVECQTLDNWRAYFLDYSKDELNRLGYCDLFKNLTSKACETVNNDLRNKIRPRLLNEDHIPIRRMKTLEKIPFGLCDDYVTLATSIMRAKGIPVCIDFTPQWPFRNQGHNWNVLLENTGINTIFEGADTSPGTPHKKDHKMAKVFRRTYAINKDIQEIYRSEKYVPATFRTPFIKDVTSAYQKTKDIEILVKDKEHKYIYLAVFDNADWVPIHWAKVEGGKAIFKDMGKDIAYLPVAYGESGNIPISNPFIVNVRGEIKTLTPNTASKQTMIVHRKYPVFEHVYSVMQGVLNLEIQASNDSLFRDAVIFDTIKKYGTQAEEIMFEKPEHYRYWRFYKSTPGGGNFFIAEIFFFKKDSIPPSYGKIIGTEGSFWNQVWDNKESAFDGDALTIFDAPYRDESWVGMDFGKPVPIEKIVYLPRSDGNLIEIGDEYELVYWQDTGWQSLGRQKAKGATLQFENNPQNALFLLHNHTKGKEERIFTYEDGNQIWW
ncbi:MAG: discoidin domain-containing protein [Dysgonomonas sp.]